jgi:hypothetical protein
MWACSGRDLAPDRGKERILLSEDTFFQILGQLLATTCRLQTGLPDFSWNKLTKIESMYQMTTKL